MVITTKGLLNVTLGYYKDEDQWRTHSKPTMEITAYESLKDIISVDHMHMHSSYKCHVMSIMFDNCSILIAFKSRATMESWITQLNNIRGSQQLNSYSSLSYNSATYIHSYV